MGSLRWNAFFLLSITGPVLRAQSFVNGDLENDFVASSAQPPGWFAVPFGDPVCMASAGYGATPDICGPTGPDYDHGIMGNPYSGSTFVSGLHCCNSHDEGIMQTVTGFNVGCTYTIGLYQAVVKQIESDATDPTGSWIVYMDNTLIGITDPSFSSEPAISLEKPWEHRQLQFTATSGTHTIKFLPRDDDDDHAAPNGIRMGIDSVYILGGGSTVTGPFLGNDTMFCSGGSLLLQTGFANAPHLWQDGSTGETLLVTEAGAYWVEVFVGCGIVRDTVFIATIPPAEVDLGDDVEFCSGASVAFDVTMPDASYIWQDGSTDPLYVATTTGVYWVQLTDGCGSVADTVQVTVVDAPTVDLGADTVLCSSGAILLDATFADATMTWQDGTSGSTYTVTAPGIYWVDVTTGCGAGSDSVVVTFADPILAEIITSDPSCNGECNGSANANVTGGTPAYVYDWIGGNGLDATGLCAGQYAFVVTDVNGCTGEVAFALVDPPTLEFGGIIATPETCPGSCDGTITVPLVDGAVFSIDGGTTYHATGELTGLCAGLLTVIRQDPSGCPAIGFTEILGPEPVVADFVMVPGMLFVDATVGQFTSVSSANVTAVSWDFGGLGTSTDHAPVFAFPENEPMNYTVCLVANDVNGCADTLCKAVVVLDRPIVHVPNAFTPDGDDVNEDFVPVLNVPSIADYEFMVFDRWGELIFESDRPGKAWDGQAGGRMVQSGVYAWTVKYREPWGARVIEAKGHVTLLR